MAKLKIGDKLIYQPIDRNNIINGEPKEVVVTKVGNKYFEIEGVSVRFYLDGFYCDNLDCGKCFINRAAHELWLNRYYTDKIILHFQSHGYAISIEKFKEICNSLNIK